MTITLGLIDVKVRSATFIVWGGNKQVSFVYACFLPDIHHYSRIISKLVSCVCIFVMKTNLMQYLYLIYFIKHFVGLSFIQQPVHVLGVFIAHHQEVFTVYVQQLVRIMAVGRVRMERITRTSCCTYTVNTS
jgi:hypothetical protein